MQLLVLFLDGRRWESIIHTQGYKNLVSIFFSLLKKIWFLNLVTNFQGLFAPDRQVNRANSRIFPLSPEYLMTQIILTNHAQAEDRLVIYLPGQRLGISCIIKRRNETPQPLVERQPLIGPGVSISVADRVLDSQRLHDLLLNPLEARGPPIACSPRPGTPEKLLDNSPKLDRIPGKGLANRGATENANRPLTKELLEV